MLSGPAPLPLHICMYVCMSVCMHVCLYVCTCQIMSTAIVATLFVQRSKVHCAATYSFCKETWNSWLPWLLVNVLTLSGSTLGLPFADAACKGVQLPDWRQLPMVFLRLSAAVLYGEASQRWAICIYKHTYIYIYIYIYKFYCMYIHVSTAYNHISFNIDV